MITINKSACVRGTSLIELITTIGIIAAIASIATPSFSNLLNNSKIDKTTTELFSVLSVARQNAITSGKDTYICELTTNNQCSTNRPFGAAWNYGWLAFQDNNQNSNLDDDDTILVIHRNHTNIGVTFNQRGRLRFRHDGSARSAGFCVCSEQSSKHILILYSGRARIRNLDNQQRIEQCLANF